ncbi:MAG: hypothetical protein DRN09_03765, partial [Thermoplasmata archaeon]
TSTVGIDSATGKWYLLEPVRYPADTVAVREVVDKALEAAYTVVVADSGNPEDRKLLLSPRQQQKIFYLSVVALPFVAILLAEIFWWKKQYA